MKRAPAAEVVFAGELHQCGGQAVAAGPSVGVELAPPADQCRSDDCRTQQTDAEKKRRGGEQAACRDPADGEPGGDRQPDRHVTANEVAVLVAGDSRELLG